MAKISAGEINKKLKRIQERFGYHVGQYAKTRQQYPQILRPSGLVKGGTGKVMSYREALRRLSRATAPEIDISYFTKDYYQQQVEKFYVEQKERLFIRTEMRKQMDKMRDIARDAFKYVGEYNVKTEALIKKFSYEELLKAIRESNAMYADTVYDSTDSPKFYERVVAKLLGNGDAETE